MSEHPKLGIRLNKICCIGAGYVGGPTMATIALKCPQLEAPGWGGLQAVLQMSQSSQSVGQLVLKFSPTYQQFQPVKRIVLPPADCSYDNIRQPRNDIA